MRKTRNQCINKRPETPLQALFSGGVVRAKLMRDSAENSRAIFRGGGEPWLMRYCGRIAFDAPRAGVTYGGCSRPFAVHRGLCETTLAALLGPPAVSFRFSPPPRPWQGGSLFCVRLLQDPPKADPASTTERKHHDACKTGN